jgi:hypothetical protein
VVLIMRSPPSYPTAISSSFAWLRRCTKRPGLQLGGPRPAQQPRPVFTSLGFMDGHRPGVLQLHKLIEGIGRIRPSISTVRVLPRRRCPGYSDVTVIDPRAGLGGPPPAVFSILYHRCSGFASPVSLRKTTFQKNR